MTEIPKFIDDSGHSTEYAEKLAKSIQTDLNALREDIRLAIPKKEELQMPEFTVKTGDSITSILRDHCSGIKYANANLLKLSYSFLFKQAKVQGGEINLIEPGDKLRVENGKLFLIRKDGNPLTDLELDIYPWTSASRPGTPPPSSFEERPEGEPTPPAPEPGPPPSSF